MTEKFWLSKVAELQASGDRKDTKKTSMKGIKQVYSPQQCELVQY